MAIVLGRLARTVLVIPNKSFTNSKIAISTIGFASLSRGKKILFTSGGILATAVAGVCYALEDSIKAKELILEPPKLNWWHKGPRNEPEWLLGLFFYKPNANKSFHDYDAASLRRGWEVYKQVCAACHGLKFIAYRHFVDAFMTEDEAKAEAAEAVVVDGPDSKGNMFTRPGKLSDYIPGPYPNEEAARYANNGAYPPDLTNITLAREGEEDYVFMLLRGYHDPPAGIQMAENQYFNLYMPGNAIAMAQALYTDAVEYSDGTPASASQMAKDVTTFLSWCGTPYLYEMKRTFFKGVIIFGVLTLLSWMWKRHVWAAIHFRKVFLRPDYKKKKH